MKPKIVDKRKLEEFVDELNLIKAHKGNQKHANDDDSNVMSNKVILLI